MRRIGVLLALVVLVVLVVLLAGCTVRVGAPAGESSWRKQADQVLGSAQSSLGTARVVLENERRIPHPYAVVSLQDAVTGLSKESGGFLTTQPPDDLRREQRTVVAALGDATTVLTQASTAVAGGTGDRTALLAQVRKAYDHLDRLRTEVGGR